MGDEFFEYLEGLAERAEAFLARHRALAPALFAAFHTVAAATYLATQTLHGDEIMIYLVARLGGIREIYSALAAGAELHPPMTYVLAHCSLGLVGDTELALRLPSILGYVLMCVCLYYLVGRYAGWLYGTAAMFFGVSLNIIHMAQDWARPYGLYVGFSALALLSWDVAVNSAVRRRRMAGLTGLGAAIVLAIWTHYYAVLLVPSIGAAEAFRCYRTRRWAPGVWIALGAASASLLGLLPLIRGVSGYSKEFTSAPALGALLAVYSDLLRGDGMPWIPLLLLGLALAGRRGRDSRAAPPEALLLCLGVVVLMPFPAYALAELVTNAFVDRYTYPATVAAIAAIVLTIRQWAPYPAAVGLTLALSLGGWTLILDRAAFKTGLDRMADDSLQQVRGPRSDERLAGNLPIVVADESAYPRYFHYWREPYRSRLVLVRPPDAARTHGIQSLARWADLQVSEYGELIGRRGSFFIVGAGEQFGSWFLPRLAADGVKVEALGELDGELLFRATAGGREP